MSNKLGRKKKREIAEFREYCMMWFLQHGVREVMDWREYNMPARLVSLGYMNNLGDGILDGYPQTIFKLTPKALELIKS